MIAGKVNLNLTELRPADIVDQCVVEEKQENIFALRLKGMRGDRWTKLIDKLEKEVYIGKDEKLPVRLIIELMPDEVFNTRMLKINKYNKKKGYKTSKNFSNRARFNLFISNIPLKIIDGEAIAKIYKIRWQIELVFKIWKSIFGLDNITPMKYERLMCTLNTRLLLVLVNWETFMIQRGLLLKKTGKLCKRSVNHILEMPVQSLYISEKKPFCSYIVFWQCDATAAYLKPL